MKNISVGFICLIVLLLLLGETQGEEKDLGTLIKGLKNKDDASRKEALQGIDKRAGYSEYSVREIEKRGAVPLLINILSEVDSNPLIKDLASSTLSKMTKHSSQVGESLLESNFMTVCNTLLRRGTVTTQEHTIAILSNIAKIGPSQRAVLAGTAAIEGFVYVLKSGTPLARESAAQLVSLLSQDPTARIRFEELNVVPLLLRLEDIGSPSGKKAAAKALLNLRAPISQSTKSQQQPQQQQQGQPTKIFKAKDLRDPVAAAVEHLIADPDPDHEQPITISFSSPATISRVGKTTTPKKQKGFVNNYRLRAPARTSHI